MTKVKATGASITKVLIWKSMRAWYRFNERGFQVDVRVSGQKLMVIRVSRAVTVCREDVLSHFLLEALNAVRISTEGCRESQTAELF